MSEQGQLFLYAEDGIVCGRDCAVRTRVSVSVCVCVRARVDG